MRTFEYGEVNFVFRDSGYRYGGALGADNISADLADFPWPEPIVSNGHKEYYVAHPALIADHLGRRGWEVLQVSQQANTGSIYVQYHFRRSSDDLPATQ